MNYFLSGCLAETNLTPTDNKRPRLHEKNGVNPNAPKPLGRYSQEVQAGNFLFISGQLAIEPKEGKLIVEDIKLQTRQIMANLKAILEAAGYSPKEVVQSTVYLSSMSLLRV